VSAEDDALHPVPAQFPEGDGFLFAVLVDRIAFLPRSRERPLIGQEWPPVGIDREGMTGAVGLA
jgi:hypothetical protein